MCLSLIKKLRAVLSIIMPILLLTGCPNEKHYYTIGGTVTGLTGTGLSGSVVLQNNGGDTLTVSANGSFTFATSILANSYTLANYNVTVSIQPLGQTCTVTGGRGEATANVTSVVVTCGTPSNLLVVNASGNLNQFSVGAAGALSQSTNVPTGNVPIAVAVSPSSQYVYVANKADATISQYTLGTGQLKAITTTVAVITGTAPTAIAADPSGAYVYVTNTGININTSGSISQYTVGSSGLLSANTITSTVSTGIAPSAIAITPSTIAADNTGPYVYVASYSENKIYEYSIGAGGVLQALSSTTITTGLAPNSIAIDPAGAYLYVTDFNDRTLYQYAIGAGGVLQASATPSVSTGGNPTAVAIDPTGQFIFVANSLDNTIYQYTLTGGVLPSAYTTTVATGSGTTPNAVEVDALGQNLYVANYGKNTVAQYPLGAGGSLSSSTPVAISSGGTLPVAIILAN